MHETIANRLKCLKFEAAQEYQNVVVLPIMDGQGDAVSYITLAEALEGRLLAVTEVTEGGSVPELKVVNNADAAVLMLDGEELAGAKQNRVLNTTVLIPANEGLVIPVSCTEQGRWSYSTDAFFDSGTVMSRSARARKTRSVSESLAASASYHSDQGEVWASISELHAAAGTHSRTSAMRDAFESRKDSLEEALKAFPCIPGQVGLLVVIGGEAAGFDVISSPEAYTRLHGKLIKSYVLDALVRKGEKAVGVDLATQAAQGFIARALECEEKTFKSVGCGNDYRFKGDHIAGSALLHSDTVIHTAFFQLDQESAEGRMSGLSRRRSYRVH